MADERRGPFRHAVGMQTTTPSTAARVSALTKTYGSHTAVSDVSFEIPRGAVVGLIGPNGAGKTTVMKAMLGLVRPTTGSIELLGERVGSAGWGATLHRVGAMIEAPPIYQRMTARENLELQAISIGLRADTPRIEEILRLVDLADRADERPRGYSLGMKQRLGIAVTLIGRPELVILDEPANGLDPAGIREIRSLLRRLPEDGTTVLVSSHQLAEVQQACDSLIVLANGRTITSGSTVDILEQHQVDAYDVVVAASERASASQALSAAGSVVSSTNDLLVVEPPTGYSGSDLNRLLAEQGIYAESIARQVVSLEAAFLEMTDRTTDTQLIGASS